MFWLIVSVLLWGFLHSLFASLQFKAFARRVFGPSVDRFYRLAYNIFAGVSFLPILVIAALTPDRRLYLVPFPWIALLIVGELLGIVVLVASFSQTDVWDLLGLRQLSGQEAKPPPKLVTGGLYRYVRHPLYSAGMAFVWLMPLMTVNVLVINIALTIYVVVGAYFEERKLRGMFGQEYVDYMAVTPMFIPFLKGGRR